MIELNDEWEILTPDGWSDFLGVQKSEKKKTLTLYFSNGSKLTSSYDHSFFINTEKIKAIDLKIGDCIDNILSKDLSIVNISYNMDEEELYDIVEVKSENHAYLLSRCFISKNCDESSFIKNSIQKEFWSAINPVLATGGSAIVTSTPNTDDDEFAQIWKGANNTVLPNGEISEVGSNGYKGHLVTWEDHPDRDEAWAEAEISKIGQEKFLREFSCRFISFNSTLIDPLALERMKPKDPIFRMGEVRWYKQPEFGKSYFVMLDPSLGTREDSAAIQVIEMPTLEHVAEWASNSTPPKGQVQVLYDILCYIEAEIEAEDDDEIDLYWSFENNSIGEAILQTIEDSGVDSFPGTLISEKRPAQQKKRFRKGINTTTKNKLLSCSKFKSLVDTDRLIPKSHGVIKQLKNFTANGASFSAKGSGNDDLVMALILCTRLIEMTKDWEIYDPDILKDEIETRTDREPLPFIVSFG
jgi:hypothetical protein